MTIVSDSSPLISLSDIGRLRLARLQAQQVFVPTEVEREVFRSNHANRTLPPWISVRNVDDRSLVEVLARSVDAGEAEAIALAEELRLPLLIDDLAGRELALSRGLMITGTLGLLLASRRSGHIRSLAPLLEDSRGAEFRMSDSLMEKSLIAAGER